MIDVLKYISLFLEQQIGPFNLLYFVSLLVGQVNLPDSKTNLPEMISGCLEQALILNPGQSSKRIIFVLKIIFLKISKL